MKFGYGSRFIPPGYDIEKDPFNLFPVPESTNYRSAHVAVLEHLPKEHFPLEIKELKSMMEKDDAFVEELSNKDFHDMFWYFTMRKWEPKTITEEHARHRFQHAIANRFELVILQKVLLGRVFSDIAEHERDSLSTLVQDELIWVNKWMRAGILLNYSEVRRKYERASGMSFP